MLTDEQADLVANLNDRDGWDGEERRHSGVGCADLTPLRAVGSVSRGESHQSPSTAVAASGRKTGIQASGLGATYREHQLSSHASSGRRRLGLELACHLRSAHGVRGRRGRIESKFASLYKDPDRTVVYLDMGYPP